MHLKQGKTNNVLSIPHLSNLSAGREKNEPALCVSDSDKGISIPVHNSGKKTTLNVITIDFPYYPVSSLTCLPPLCARMA